MKIDVSKLTEAKELTVQEFMAQNPDFIKPILVGSVLGTIRSLCSDPSQISYFEDEVNQIITGMLSKPAADIFRVNRPMPCAQADCYYNNSCTCTKEGYTGPTMEGSCKHYSRD